MLWSERISVVKLGNGYEGIDGACADLQWYLGFATFVGHREANKGHV